MENDNPNTLLTKTVTERVDARLVRRNFEDYAQIAREEGTSPEFVAKRAHDLKKDGKISGDRRNSKQRQQANNNEMPAAELSDKVFSERMKAYKLLNIPAEDLEIMEQARTDIHGLIKMRQDARALRHDKLAEEVSNQFKNLTELRDFVAFHGSVRSRGVTRADYESVMSMTSESLSLDKYISKHRTIAQALKEETSDRIAQKEEASRNLCSLKDIIKALGPAVDKLELKYNQMLQAFRSIGEGKEYRQEVSELVCREYGKILDGDAKWRLLVQIVFLVSSRFPAEFQELAQALSVNDIAYVNANAERLYPPLLEAYSMFRREMEREATEALRRQILDSIPPPRA
jgi:hypothetical protein